MLSTASQKVCPYGCCMVFRVAGAVLSFGWGEVVHLFVLRSPCGAHMFGRRTLILVCSPLSHVRSHLCAIMRPCVRKCRARVFSPRCFRAFTDSEDCLKNGLHRRSTLRDVNWTYYINQRLTKSFSPLLSSQGTLSCFEAVFSYVGMIKMFHRQQQH